MTDYLREQIEAWQAATSAIDNDKADAASQTLGMALDLLDSVRCDKCVRSEPHASGNVWCKWLSRRVTPEDVRAPQALADECLVLVGPKFHCAAFQPKESE